MTIRATPLDSIAPQTCLCYGPEAEGCLCMDAERALRAYMGKHPMPPMTSEQRAYCLEEIGSVEGYERTDYEACTDEDLARGVLSAWVDYCRDKGLL